MAERIGIIGGGIIGVAIGRRLAAAGDYEVTVLEKESRVASHQTGHNSGVVHAGLYYTPGSLKARLCTAGRAMIREYCEENGLPYRELGKLVVATSADEMPRLDDIERRARENQVPGITRLTGTELRDIEPHVRGVAAVHSPHTAVVDYAAITEQMAQEIRRHGGEVLLGHEVRAIHTSDARSSVSTSSGTFGFDKLIVCAGLHSDLIAMMVGGARSPKILPFRGEYWSMKPERGDLVKGMVYPVPDPRFPFLGVHFTRGVYDDVHVGPNAVPALAREGYKWRNASPREIWESVTWPGARKMAAEHGAMGAKEIAASIFKKLYFKEAKRFIPELKISDLSHKSAAGVRAQAWAEGGALLDDFAIEQIGSVTLVRNAPSPAATSSMAIADYILDHYLHLTDKGDRIR